MSNKVALVFPKEIAFELEMLGGFYGRVKNRRNSVDKKWTKDENQK